MSNYYTESLDAARKAAQDSARAAIINRPYVDSLRTAALAAQAAADAAAADAASASSSAAESLSAALNAANLVGAPADTAIAAAVNGAASSTRAAGDTIWAPNSGAVVSAARNGVAAGNTAAANTTALNNLHTSAAAVGAVIELPKGTIAVDALTLKAPMRGAGMGRTTLVASATATVAASGVALEQFTLKSANQTAFIAANLTDLTLSRVQVDFDASVTTNHLALNPFNVDRMRVLNCRFRIGGIQLSGCDDFLIDGNYWDCEYLNINEPCHISGQSFGQFVNNTVYRTATDAVDMFSSGRHCIISGNRFYGLRGGCGIECKISMSDDVGNTSAPGNKFEATIISNNVLADFNHTVSGTRMGIYAEWVDNRAAAAFSVAESNRAIVISGNIIDGMNTTDPGAGVINSFRGIAYTGHNGLIVNNMISNARAWQGATPTGIYLAQPAGTKCVGVRVSGNVISGIEGAAGIQVGTLDRCQIDGNIVRGTEETGVQTRWGVSIDAGKTLTDCSISNNVFECNYATGFGVRAASSTVVLSKVTVSNNTLRDCGVSLTCSLQFCGFVGNQMDNALNSQGFNVGVAGTSSRGNRFLGNHVTMSADYALVVADLDGFVITGNTFQNTARAVLLQGLSRNGLVDNNLSIVQSSGTEFPHYSGVSAPDQATITVGANKVLAS